ncbi:MAG: type II toxin-antitoxin system prevent-host-death family antitoxin [Rhizonema sp. PD38]|nr:type II toxin-antitoxin system prevent-host-death family antitoxin [Rhizonema sp. PD38]
MQKINIDEAVQNLYALIEAAISGEEILIVKDEESIVKLTPISPVKRLPLLGSPQDLIIRYEDHNKSSDDFKDFML